MLPFLLSGAFHQVSRLGGHLLELWNPFMGFLRDLRTLAFDDDVLLFDFSPTPMICELLPMMLPQRKVVAI